MKRGDGRRSSSENLFRRRLRSSVRSYDVADLIVKIGLLDIRQNSRVVSPAISKEGASAVTANHVAHWKDIVGIVVVMQGESKLLQVILALCSASCLASLLHRGEQKGDQIAMIAITNESSISVNARRGLQALRDMAQLLILGYESVEHTCDIKARFVNRFDMKIRKVVEE